MIENDKHDLQEMILIFNFSACFHLQEKKKGVYLRPFAQFWGLI
jgi:hypothetical protein